MGKGEIAHYEQFLLFPQCFQKACFPGASKCVIVWEWVNTLQKNPLENIVGKGENAGNQHFLFFPQYFLSCLEQISVFSHISFVVYKSFEFDLSKIFTFGKELRLILQSIYYRITSHSNVFYLFSLKPG